MLVPTGSFVLSPGPQPSGSCHPHTGWVFPLELSLSGDSFISTHTQIYISLEIPILVNLRVKISCHRTK